MIMEGFAEDCVILSKEDPVVHSTDNVQRPQQRSLSMMAALATNPQFAISFISLPAIDLTAQIRPLFLSLTANIPSSVGSISFLFEEWVACCAFITRCTGHSILAMYGY